MDLHHLANRLAAARPGCLLKALEQCDAGELEVIARLVARVELAESMHRDAGTVARLLRGR